MIILEIIKRLFEVYFSALTNEYDNVIEETKRNKRKT
jgi:hypothetical protein